MSTEIEQAIASGDMEALSEMITGETPEETLEPTPEEVPEEILEQAPEEKEAEPEVETPKAEDEPAEPKLDPVSEPKLVMTKDGKHALPYKVVGDLRSENADLKSQAGELQKAIEEQQALLKKLERSGIDINNVKDPTELTQEQLTALDDYEDLSPAMKAMYFKNQDLQDQIDKLTASIAPADEQANDGIDPEVVALVNSDPELKGWLDNPETSKDATDIDDDLRADPDYANTSLEQRIPEIKRQMRQKLAEPKQEKIAEAKKIVEQTLQEKTTIPNSLTDSGIPPTIEKSPAERIAEMNGADLIEKMGSMSSSQINQLLEGIK